MINVKQILFELCENEDVLNPDFDLLESGALDSFMFIELFSRFEDEGIHINPARIDRESLRTPCMIEKLINEIIFENKDIQYKSTGEKEK